MQLLRVFSIIIALVLIIASSNVSFKSDNDVNPGINIKAPLTDSILLSTDDKSSFSSLLQTISAQEQYEVDQEENGKDSDSDMEREEEEQDRGDSETEPSIEQEQEQHDSEKEQKEQDEIREDCGPTEHFDSEVDSCISDPQKVCNDDRDNDNRVDSEDSGCLSNKSDQEQQQENKDQDKEKLLPGGGEEEPSLANKQDNNSGENPVPIEQQQGNNTSSDSFDTEDKAQNSQNSTNGHSKETTTSNNNASFNEFHQANTSAAAEDGFALNCHPAEAEMLPGEEDSIICTIENKTPKPIEMVLECSGLQDTGIECYINGESLVRRTSIREMSYTDFSVLIVSRSSPTVPAGSYPFTISAEDCINSDHC